MNKVDFIINRLSLFIFSKSNSKPIKNNKKYIPNQAKNLKVSEETISEKGFLKAKIKPKIREAKIQGILILSKNIPKKKVNKNIPPKNKAKFIFILQLSALI